MNLTNTLRAILDTLDSAKTDAHRARLLRSLSRIAENAAAGYEGRPSGTACDVIAFAKHGGPVLDQQTRESITDCAPAPSPRR
jgi:hypothetical protein